MGNPSARAYNIHDLRELARRRLPRALYEFVERGTEDDVAIRNNREAFERIKLRPRVLRDVSGRTLEVDLFGRKQKMPLGIAPTGMAGLLWHEGEIALARAAAEAGIPFSLSTGSITGLERVAAEAGGRLWFQLYLWKDRKLSYQLVERAAAAGYEALLVTLDTVVMPNREYNLHNGLTQPYSITLKNALDNLTHPGWLAAVMLRYVLKGGIPRFENYPAELKRSITAQPLMTSSLAASLKPDSLTWDDLRTLRKLWRGPLIAKGILHPQDAVLAADCGADGVLVSNHGGRNLDSAIATIDALPEIVDAVGHRLTVLADSGFRRGSDIVKALALGAKAVLVGRGTLWGIAADGERGAARALQLYREETLRVMAFLGCSAVSELGPHYLQLPGAPAMEAPRPAYRQPAEIDELVRPIAGVS